MKLYIMPNKQPYCSIINQVKCGIMNYLNESIQAYIFKVKNEKVFVNKHNEISLDIKQIIKTEGIFNDLFNTTLINEEIYYIHNIPTGLEQFITILFKPAADNKALNKSLLSYSAANMLLHHPHTFQFTATEINFELKNVGKKLFEKIQYTLTQIAPNAAEKLRLKDYVYIRLVAASCTSELIGKITDLSYRTVEDRVKKITSFFNCHTRREVAEFCHYIINESVNIKTLIPSTECEIA